MSSPAPVDRPERLVLRGLGSVWIVIVCGVAGILLSGDAFLRGRPDVGIPTLLWFALLCWLVYSVLIRPGAIVTRRSVTLLNVWWRREVPWSAIERLSSTYQLRLHLRGGRVLRSWGAPSGTGALTGSDGRGGARRGRGLAATRPADEVVEEWLERAGGPVPGTPDTPTITGIEPVIVGVTVALIVGAVAAQLLA